MAASTPGFIGERLREARQVRGVRANQLAEMLGMSPQAISSYEKGHKNPIPEVAEAIAKTLNVPLNFFMRPVAFPTDRPVFYRSMSTATQKARDRAEGRLHWLEDLSGHLSKIVEFPMINLPDFGVPDDPSLLSDEDIEHIAEDARKFWNMSDGPIANMVFLLENQGVVVARDNLGDVKLDSLSTFGDRPYVMIGTDKGTAVRWRYDAAHELGHLLLHRKLNPKALTRGTEFNLIEKQAHRFAAAFLLPMAPFADAFFSASLDILRAIKPHWRVSILMMILRARDGNLISEDHKLRLIQNYHRRRWSRNEPLDDSLEAEEPSLLRKAVHLTLDAGALSGGQFADTVALAPTDIESLCGLHHGYLRAADEPTVTLRASQDEAIIYSFQHRARRG